MPIYEYGCNKCGKVSEVLQKMSDKPIKKCTFCKSTKIKKLISQSSFRLEGGGWAEDGYVKDDSFDINGQGLV